MIIKEFNKTLGELRWRHNELSLITEKNDKEIIEHNAISEFLHSLTIERKKNKNGKYTYFITDKTGKIVQKLRGCYDGKELNILWAFTHKRKTHEYEKKETMVRDFDKDDSYLFEYAETKGGEEIEVKFLINNSGKVIFDGIREIIQYDYPINDNDEIILIIEPELHKELIQKTINSFWSDFDKPVYCVIDLDGGIVIKPTQQKIVFDYQHKKYILY